MKGKLEGQITDSSKHETGWGGADWFYESSDRANDFYILRYTKENDDLSNLWSTM